MKSKESIESFTLNCVADIEKDLRYIACIIKQKGREILNQYKITPPQFIALQWLFEDGDMTIGELSSKMYLACSTMTDLIDRMEKNQLVARMKDSQDRRVVRIQLLEEGERIIDEVIQKRQLFVQQTLSDFNDTEIMSLKNNLMKMHQEMKKDRGEIFE
ncbi:DNA-binding MarR family transcriptional regulator [Oikeobacillus pervagus]|uniref:DNA-binding MarR family transcriptional regulator n=1 Tax=Oikeobacillus pervagus TaxID=1325931 RepID=A0AAJ1T2D5_9BACI|nr:MarR family transcriptional regulator [Oikeobacillus pervagus]MDQ0215426.1 DNA-binding MarR family transcriptional regulator [Oikeobacillus pervagus]